jgi:hypothetical protein
VESWSDYLARRKVFFCWGVWVLGQRDDIWTPASDSRLTPRGLPILRRLLALSETVCPTQRLRTLTGSMARHCVRKLFTGGVGHDLLLEGMGWSPVILVGLGGGEVYMWQRRISGRVKYHHFSTIFTFAGSSAAGSAIWGSGGGALLSLALLLLTFLPAAVPSATILYVP